MSAPTEGPGTVGAVKLSDVPCDAESLAALRTLVATPQRGHLVVLSGPGDLPAVAAHAFAQAVARPGTADMDVRRAAPDKDRWSVEEVSERVIAAAALMPMDRTIVIVEQADMMDVSAAEHLLKTVEEPPSRSLFVFAVRDEDRLLPTLRGRAAAVVRVTPKPPRDRAADLAAAGMDLDAAREVVDLAGEMTAVASAVAAQPELLGPLRRGLGAPLRPDRPAADTADIIDALAEVARAVEPEASARLETLDGDDSDQTARRTARKVADAVVKSRSRTLLRTLLANWRAEVSARLRAEELDAATFQALAATVEQLDSAERALGLFVPPAHVLNAVLSAAPAR